MKGYREKEFFQKDRKCPETKVPKKRQGTEIPPSAAESSRDQFTDCCY